MTQIGESVTVIVGSDATEKCVFCEKDHQDEKAAGPASFPRNMSKLKSEGRTETIGKDGRVARYPSSDRPPLVEWSRDISKVGGYKAAAHHCIALKTVSNHRISGELKEAGYDPNNGYNCIWLPYSQGQFVRARAYYKPLQKHRGGHTDQYFTTVKKHVDKIGDDVAKKFCTESKKASKERLLRYTQNAERWVWMGVASASDVAYHLYNTSYLDPTKPWGWYDEEKGRSRADVLADANDPAALADDAKAAAESAEDPE